MRSVLLTCCALLTIPRVAVGGGSTREPGAEGKGVGQFAIQ